MRDWLSRRSVWVAIGPWMGFLFWAGVYGAVVGTDKLVTLLFPRGKGRLGIPWSGLDNRVMAIAFVGSLAYGWLIPAHAALRRAAAGGPSS